MTSLSFIHRDHTTMDLQWFSKAIGVSNRFNYLININYKE